MKKKLFVFCLDALCSSDIEKMMVLPHFRFMFENGAYVRHIEPVYPSLTYPCHCSIITGKYVKGHGVPHNEIVQAEVAHAPWYNQRSDVKCETLFDYAKKAGYQTCSLTWPVSGKADIDLNMPMIVPIGYQGFNPYQFLEGNASKELLDRYYYKHGRYLKGIDRNLDAYTMALALDIIEDYHQPDVMFVKMCDLDSVRHQYGVENDYVNAQLVKHDEEFGALVESIKRFGDFENTDFVILGDHGQQDVRRHININVLLKNAGFIRCDENGQMIDYDAYCHSASLSAWVQLKNPEDGKMRQKVYAFLKEIKADPQYNIGYLFTKEEAEEQFGLVGPLDFVIEGKEPMTFDATLEGVDIFEKHLTYGHDTLASHGHLPSRDETTTFIACGPSVQRGVVVDRASMVDEAPTMAKMLGLEMNDVDGHVLNQLLEEKINEN